MKANVIAIDGPSGSGKSTIAKALSQELGITYMDTGAMYRGLGLVLNRSGVKGDDEEAIARFLESMVFEYGRGEEELILIDGENLTETIREHQVSKLASIYSKSTAVRAYLKKIQRNIVSERTAVLEGRDIGTVIFPDALLKIYLTASSEVRAKRRLQELQDKGEEHSLEKIKDDIERRDFEDMNRSIAPLKKAVDAVKIDSDAYSIEEIVKQISILYAKSIV